MSRNKTLAVIGTLVIWCGMASAEASHPVGLPTIFLAEDRPMPTAACLQAAERTYTRAGWWEDTGGSNDDAAERAFKATLVAFKREDREGLLQLSHPTLGRDPKRFDEQASAFFQQFQIITVSGVSRAYELDNLVVFYAKLQIRDKIAFVPFVFAREANGAYGFLPYRTDALTYQLLDGWFQSDWGPSKAERPTYCTDDEIKHATHRISLIAPPAGGSPSLLLLKGGPVDMSHPGLGMAASIKATFDQMTAALTAGKRDEFVKHLSPDGAKRLKEWFDSATEADFNTYRSAILAQKPYFFLDASPLVIVYTKSAKGEVQALYFTPGARGALLWTNSSYLTISDAVYKSGPLMRAAMLEKPFSTIEIK
jgi:hypothetical protein